MEKNDVLIEYILGGLSEAERERLEQEYFVNNETWEKLRAIEDDLIDSYVRGKLPAGQREPFEKHFLASPGRCRRVEFARALLDPAVREAEESSAPPELFSSSRLGWPFAMRLAVAAASVVLAAAATFFLFQNFGLRRELRQARSDAIGLQNEIQSLRRQMSEAQQTNPSGTSTASVFSSQAPTISLLLTPGLLRNGKNPPPAQVLPIPAAPAEVLLLLSLQSDEYPEYDVRLRTAEGRPIRHVEGLTSQALRQGDRVIAIRLPAQLFPAGDYIATLSGKTAKGKQQTVDSYTFSVTR